MPPGSAVGGGVRPGGRIFYGWYIVAASVALNFYLSLTFFLGFQAFFLPILTEFGWSRTLMSGAFSLGQLEMGLMSPLVGFLVDRWGPRPVILTGVLLAGAGMVFMGLMSSAWMFYLAYLTVSTGMSGAGHGISWPAIVANWFRRRRGLALGATFLGPVFSGPFVVLIVLLEEALGWRTALVALGIGVWLIGIPLAVVARPRPEPYGYLPDGDPLPEENNASSSPSAAEPPPGIRHHSDPPEGLSVSQVFRTSSFWLLAGIFAVHGFGLSGFMVHQVPLYRGVGFSAREAALVLGLVFFLSGIGRLSAGVLMDRLDKRAVLVGVLLLQTVSYLILTLLSTSWWLVVSFALLFGPAFGSTIPARPILVREHFGSRAFGAINGLILGVSIGPGIVGPMVMGRVFDLRGSYTAAILAFAGLTAIISPLPLLLRAPASERRSVSR